MSLLDRAVADIRDRPAWSARRSRAIGASDAAKFAKEESAHLYLRAKLHNPFEGNSYTTHGNNREPQILASFGLEQNHMMFRSETNPRHVATPDAYRESGMGLPPVLAQVKTTSKPLTKIPLTYWRQMQWELYVMGADVNVFIWEEHQNYQPVRMEPDSLIVHRDDAEIEKLVRIADIIIDGMDAADQFRIEMEQS